MSPAILYADGGDAAGEEGNADHLAGRHPAALCHRRGGEFGMPENNGWQMRYHLRIEPPLWRCGLRQNFRVFQQRISGDIGHVTERERRHKWTPLFYEDHPAREFCVQYGKATWRFWRGCGRRRYFLL
ncbi:MAG: contractile injection system protein, VgrG/Pvc8 family [Escherichia sp.]